ncbi:ras guanine nucleotide exchange factor P-like [Adelges cooleyi]|uniref:ras guanine nucleotide exchange factor P-like n=1 Tax=Adelges cooleyi TaxID=133065 RepID=UPI00217F6D5B|nr:ras guanine nucleotide exchange factor P-like [Adelges cooleyi]
MDTCVDPKLPPWKIELINRRRTRNNQSKCTGGGHSNSEQQVKPVQWTWSPTTQHFLQQPANAVQTSQQQQQQSAVGAVCSNMRLLKCDTVIMTNFKKNPQINRCRSKFKTKPQIITEITNGLDYQSDSSEEFKYGPGIVNKLKSKYMSMTVREQKPRPPLWRSNSMDNLVEDKHCQEKPKHISPPDVISVAAAVKSETLKRARSLEALSESQAANTNGDKEEQHQPITMNAELPPPDVVKTYKKIFETKTQIETKPIKIKPAIMPKPMLSPEKTRPVRMNKVPLKKNMLPPVKYPNRLKKKEPLGLDRSKSLINDEVSSSQDESSMSSDDGSSVKHRVVIKTNINGSINDNKIVAVQTKQICVIRPTTRTVTLPEETSNAQLSDKEIEKNFLNNNNNNTNNNNSNGEKRLGGLWDKKRWDNNENSVVFNFVNRKGVPNYIDSEGPIPRRDNPCGIKNGCIMLDAHCEESSTDDIDSANNDNYVIFIGDNIIIGRSNLRNGNSSTPRKNLRIQFSDVLETTHEYPSEASLLLEEEHNHHHGSPPLPSSEGDHENSVKIPPKNSFGSYTPCKLGTTEEAFLGEYGVSRNNVIRNVKRVDKNDETTTTDQSAIDSNVPWSEETTPDLLF